MKYTVSDKSLYVSGPAKIHVVDGACAINFKEFQKEDILSLPHAKSVDIIPNNICEIEIEEGNVQEQEIPPYYADRGETVKKLSDKNIILVLGNSDVGKTNVIIQV